MTTTPSPHEGRRWTLFGRVYVWTRGPRGWSARLETEEERQARLDAVRAASDAARARARGVAGQDQPAELAATLAQIDALEAAARR